MARKLAAYALCAVVLALFWQHLPFRYAAGAAVILGGLALLELVRPRRGGGGRG